MSIEITTASHILLSSIRLALEESFNNVPSTSSIQPFIGNNSASGYFSSILGGQNNDTNSQANTFILGSNITASLSDYTYVNNVSSQGIVSTGGGTSNNWNDAYTSVNSTSASWNEAYTSTLSAGLSTANWNSTFTSMSTLSSGWQQTTTYVAVSSPSWNDASTKVQTLSSLWGTGGDPFNASLIATTSGNWDSVYTNVNSLSTSWNSTYITVSSLSADWGLATASVLGNSYNWSYAYNNAVYAISGTQNQIIATKSGTNSGDNAYTLCFPQSAIFPGDVTINGNLTIEGSATYVTTSNLIVDDPLIYIASGNIGNAVDIGLIGHFTQAPLGYNHTGFVRRAGQGNPGVWTLFSGLTTEPVTGINIDWDDKNIVVDTLSANLIGNVSDNLGGNNVRWNSVYTNYNTATADNGYFDTKYVKITTPTVYDYKTPGTSSLTIPTGYTKVRLQLLGGGGGGGAGRKDAASTTRYGGGGGAGGAYIDVSYTIAGLPSSTLTINVGAAGTHGIGATNDSTAGSDGSNGGDSTVNSGVRTLAAARGGGGGIKGNTTSSSGAGGKGTGGGSGGDAASPNADSVYSNPGRGDTYGGGGAGGGGNITSANVVGSGGISYAGGTVGSILADTIPGAGNASGNGGNGASGNSSPFLQDVDGIIWGGQGGAGGGASSYTGDGSSGGTGGNGTGYGAGGGGGGASTNTTTPNIITSQGGNGGDGVGGYIRIIFS